MIESKAQKVVKPLLIVEDDEATLAAMVALSRRPSRWLDLAMNYPSAMKLLEHTVTIMVSGGNIPGSDGAELLVRVPKTLIQLVPNR